MTELVVSVTIDGLHFWPNAPEQYKEFGQPHRHLFKIICFYPTGDSSDPNRREKELWELRQETLDFIFNDWEILGSGAVDFGAMSCEGISDRIKDGMGFSKVFVGEEFWIGALVT